MQYNFKGIYDATVNYVKQDVVMYTSGGTTKIFYCLTDNGTLSPQTPNVNTDSVYWAIINTSSNFPNSIDNFITRTNILESEKADVNRFQVLLMKTRTTDEEVEFNNLLMRYRDKLFLPDDVNQIQNAILSLQMFLKSNIEGYLAQKQAEFNARIEQFKDRGIYSPTTQYFSTNLVKFNGNVYMAKQNSLGQTPVGDDADLYWRLLGMKGDKGDSGVAVTLKGEYNNSTTYQIGDGILYGNQIYYAKQITTGNLPTDSNYWVLSDKIYVSISPPAAPVTNQIWLDISIAASPRMKYWNGTTWTEFVTKDSDKLGGQLPAYYATAQSVTDVSNEIGILSNLATTDKSSVVNAINELKINGSYKLKGSSTFNSTTGVVISHSIGNTTYTVLLSPTANPNGFLGEVWIEKAANSFKVCCSGTATSTFDYVVF